MQNQVIDGISLSRAAGKAAKGEPPTNLQTAIRTAPMYAIKNKKHISSLTMCGCFSCLEYFGACEIAEWTDNSQTALCPKCGADCVVPSSILGIKDYYPVGNEPHPVLKAIQQYWIPQISLHLTQNTTGPAPAVVVNSAPADKVSELLVLSGLDESGELAYTDSDLMILDSSERYDTAKEGEKVDPVQERPPTDVL